MKKVFLDNLPRLGGTKGIINWKRSIGYKVKFIYDNIEGKIEILNYNAKNQTLFLKYENQEFSMYTQNFINCRFGVLLGVQTYTREYKYENGTIIDNIKYGKLLLLEKIKMNQNRRGYRYECMYCGNIDKITETNLLDGHGCNVCGGHKTLEGYNDIWTTDPWFGKLFWDNEDGHKYKANSDQTANFKCPDCELLIENKRIADIYKMGNVSCPCCSDGLSYPEKFTYSVLSQAGVEFKYQETFEWSKNFNHDNPKLCGDKRYDFYLYDFETIVEVHGIQHYEKSSGLFDKNRLFEEDQENDKIKEQLAINNKRKFIVIDARCSEMEFIKNNILNSKLAELIDFSNVDWLKCHEYALSSLVRKACDIWNSGVKSTKEIGEKIGVSSSAVLTYLKQGKGLDWCDYDPKAAKIRGSKEGTLININRGKENIKKICYLWNNGMKSTREIENETKFERSHVIKCLKQGVKLGWCDYNPKEEIIKNNESAKLRKNRIKPIVRLNLIGVYMDEFISATEASRELNIARTSIGSACLGRYESAGGFKWMFKEDYKKMLLMNKN